MSRIILGRQRALFDDIFEVKVVQSGSASNLRVDWNER
jgi:hypothetical protein